jgi:hypothetical protein
MEHHRAPGSLGQSGISCCTAVESPKLSPAGPISPETRDLSNLAALFRHLCAFHHLSDLQVLTATDDKLKGISIGSPEKKWTSSMKTMKGKD